MNTFIRSASILTLAAAMAVSAASFAAASQNGGSPGGPGSNGSGPNGDGRGGFGNSPSAPEHANPNAVHVPNVIPIGGNNNWYPRRVRDTNQHPCVYLYYSINRSNALATVPQYRECLKLNGEY